MQLKRCMGQAADLSSTLGFIWQETIWNFSKQLPKPLGGLMTEALSGKWLSGLIIDLFDTKPVCEKCVLVFLCSSFC